MRVVLVGRGLRLFGERDQFQALQAVQGCPEPLSGEAGEHRVPGQQIHVEEIEVGDGGGTEGGQQAQQRPGHVGALTVQQVQGEFPGGQQRAAGPLVIAQSGVGIEGQVGHLPVEAAPIRGERAGRRRLGDAVSACPAQIGARQVEREGQPAEVLGELPGLLLGPGSRRQITEHLGAVRAGQQVDVHRVHPVTPAFATRLPAGEQYRSGRMAGRLEPAGPLGRAVLRQQGEVVDVVEHQQPGRGQGIEPLPQDVCVIGARDQVAGCRPRGERQRAQVHGLALPVGSRHPPDMGQALAEAMRHFQGDGRLTASAHPRQQPHPGHGGVTPGTAGHRTGQRVHQPVPAPQPLLRHPALGHDHRLFGRRSRRGTHGRVTGLGAHVRHHPHIAVHQTGGEAALPRVRGDVLQAVSR